MGAAPKLGWVKMNTAYDVITDRILELLDKGVIPWRKPWAAGAAGFPKNGASKKAYRGINIFMLSAAGYSSPAWFTYRQAVALGGQVRKGEKGYPVVFWKMFDRSTDSDDSSEGGDGRGGRKVPVLRYYTVFNAEQIDGLPADLAALPEPVAHHDPIEAAAAIVAGMPNRPELHDGGAQAFYSPSLDSVTVPKLEQFTQAQEWYSTMFHELAHSTMHASRLNRREKTVIAAFGSSDYGREELLAEFAASFLCGASGIAPATVENSAAYINAWKEKIKADRKMVVMAAAQAQKAADYILGKHAGADGEAGSAEPATVEAVPAGRQLAFAGF
jgi:antirestriction protein ArdC